MVTTTTTAVMAAAGEEGVREIGRKADREKGREKE